MAATISDDADHERCVGEFKRLHDARREPHPQLRRGRGVLLPVDRLLPHIGRLLNGGPPRDRQTVATTLDAVNRRGLPTRLEVTLRPLYEDEASVAGLILVTSAQ